MNGHQVKLSDYSCKSLRELLDKIPDVVRTVGKEKHKVVLLANRVEATEGKKKKTRRSLKKKCPELESNSDILFTFLSSGKTDAVVTLDSDTEEEEEAKASEDIHDVTDSEDVETISWTAGESEDSIDDGRDLLQNTPTGLEETFDKTLTLSETAEAEPEASTNVAIFWDIENCPVPKGVSTSDFVSKIRETFCGAGHRELEFRAIHNGKNEKLNEELHELGVDASLSVVGRKNSADEIIKDKMTKFVEAHRESPCTLLLISGDVDFSRDLVKFRFTNKFKTILVHNKQTKETLKSVVTERFPIENLFLETEKEKGRKSVVRKKENKSVGTEFLVQPKSTFFIQGERNGEIPEEQGLQFFHELRNRIVSKFDVEAILEENSFRLNRGNGLVTLSVQLTLLCGKKKARRCKLFIDDCSEPDFRIICIEAQDEASKICRVALKNEETKKKAQIVLKSKMKNSTNKHQMKIDVIEEEIKKEAFKSEIQKTLKRSSRANKLLEAAAVSVSSNLMIVNLEKEAADLKSQLEVFSATCQENFKQIEDLDIELSKTEFDAQLSEIRFKLGKEFITFENPLPIYKFRREIQQTVQDNSVTILMAETGSGKSTQVVQYLHEKFPDKMIVCTQPRKIAAVSLAGHVAKQMGSHVGGLVGYRVGSQVKMSRQTRIVFMTDQLLVNDCVRDPDFSKYHCVILDEVHERSINTDLLLGLAKNGLKTNPDLKVVITSATMDPKIFFAHFEERESNIKVETKIIPGRTFPIEMNWTNQSIDTSRDYLASSLKKVEEILESTQRGDILVFLATPADTDLLSNRLRQRNSHVESLQLHGKLQIEEQKKIFEPGVKRRVIFSTNCAETSVTVPGIKYVVDPGIAKEKKFDPVRNSSSLVLQRINRSSAQQRAGRAGRTEPGVCFRLYSQQEFLGMDLDTVAEIKRVQLGQTILKLIDLGISRPDNFPFIESPGVENLRNSISALESLEALTVDEASGDPKLTDLGLQMSKLPLEPRLSKLVLVSNSEGDGETALVMASLCSMAGNVFFRLGSHEDCSQADQKKINFCDERGDFLTLVNVFTEWSQVAEKKKSQWCVTNFINGKSMKMARDMLNDLKSVFKNDLNMTVTAQIPGDDEDRKFKRLQLNIFKCFRRNLCVFGGDSKYGYINVRTHDVYPIHPSSAFSYLGNLVPQLIIYDQILSTSRTFLLSLSCVEDDWLSEEERSLLLQTQDRIVTPGKIGPVGPRIMIQSMIGSKWSELKELERELKSCIGEENFFEITCNVEAGSITFATNKQFHSFVETVITEKIKVQQQVLLNECQEIPLIQDKSRPKAIIGAGGVIEDIILENEFSDFMIKFDYADGDNEDNETFYEICDYATAQPGLIKIKKLRKTGDRVVVMRNFRLASEALKKVQQFAEVNKFPTKSIYPLTSSRKGGSQTGIEVKLSIPRRRLQKFGFIKFDCEEDAFRVLSHMDTSSMVFGAHCLRLRADKRGDKKSLYFGLNRNFVTPPNLVTELKEKLNQNEMPFKDVFIPLGAPYESNRAEVRSLKAAVTSVVTQSMLATESDFDVDMRMPSAKSGTWLVKLNFSSSVIGINVGNYLKRRSPSINWNQTENGTNPRREYCSVDFNLTTSFSCPRKVFDVLRETIEKTVKEVSDLFVEDSESLKLDIKPFEDGERSRAVFYIRGTNLAVLARTKDALDNILTG